MPNDLLLNYPKQNTTHSFIQNKFFNKTFIGNPQSFIEDENEVTYTDPTIKLLEDNVNEQLKKQVHKQTAQKQTSFPIQSQCLVRLKSANISRPPLGTNKQSHRILPSTQPFSVYIPILYGSNKTAINLANIGKYQIKGALGQGSYATVKLASTHNNNKVALKFYDKAKLHNPCKRVNIQREIQILEKLSHKNTIKLIEVVDEPNELILVMEFAQGIAFSKYLEQQPGKKLPETAETKQLVRQVIEGVQYCHSKNIIHRDLKLDNILFDEKSQTVKIIDFGFSIIAHSGKRLQIFCGTPKYMAPEIILKKQYYGQFVDIWALGVILFVILCGEFPFQGKNECELFRKIVSGQYDIANNLSENAKDLIKKLLVLNPVERLTAAEILEEPWFKEK